MTVDFEGKKLFHRSLWENDSPLLCDFPDECTGSVPNFKIVVIITDLCEMPDISN